MTTKAPPAEPDRASVLPEDPAAIPFPDARLVTPPAAPDRVSIESSGPQTYHAGLFTLDGDVVIRYEDRRVQADHIEYDSKSGDLTASGHLLIADEAGDQRLAASHGTYNLKTGVGRFYDVTGSVGLKTGSSAHRAVYNNAQPVLFSGRMVVKSGPRDFDVYDGTVTACQLPHPDWTLSSAHFSVDEEMARAHNSVFRLLNIPLIFLPYVTHPVDSEARQSGFLVPVIGQSNTKGLVLGEQVYVAIDRSNDLLAGAEYYSSIGWAQNAAFRHRGLNLDFVTLRYASVLDRRAGTANQGGEEVVLAGRHDFTPATRVAANIDYLSSYVYREAFSPNFNLAVTSEIVSTAYLSHASDGVELAGLADRYEGIKQLAQPATARQPARPQQEVRIFHAPTLSLSTTDRRVPGTAMPLSTGLEVSLDAEASGLKRSQLNFATSGIVERFDFHPSAAYPISMGQWHVRPSIAGRETFYTRSRATATPGQAPSESPDSLTRSDFEFSLEVRPPVLTRTFQPTRMKRMLGSELRHTIEPALTYRLTDGISNFNNVLRFDATDVASNTNEAEYGFTQRLFRRTVKPLDPDKSADCTTAEVARAPGFNAEPDADGFSPPPERAAKSCPNEEFISWRLTQKYFFDQNFGGAIVTSRRNILTNTLDLSGVAFLTEPRAISPLISRLRFRTSARTDVEWDFDLDTGAGKFNSSNVFIDLHQGNAFGAISYARLDAPGRFFTQTPTPVAGLPDNGATSAISDFNQLRVLLGYGSPTKPGLSLAANTGLDLKSLYGATTTATNGNGVVTSTNIPLALLQYATVQASYNWNCCGLAIEYRKFELGSVRNEGTYGFLFTLANIGAAGNLRRAQRLF